MGLWVVGFLMVASIEEREMENKIIEKDERVRIIKKKEYSNKMEKNTTFDIECITKWVVKIQLLNY